MLRPASKQPRLVKATCRFTDAEHERLERRAEAGGHASVSAFMRARCLTDPAERRGRGTAKPAPAKLAVVADPRPSDQAAAMLTEQIRRAGVNLNQIAHHLNEGRGYTADTERELRAALAEVRFVVRRAREL